MAGLIGIGANTRGKSLDAFGTSSKLEQRRERKEEQLEAQERQGRISSISQGAGLGLAASAQIGAIGGPAGAAIGAGVGLLANELF